jgi:glycosyltransferase involved in cell wall biosynthesis
LNRVSVPLEHPRAKPLPMAGQRANGVVHIVEHMAPGGIETFVLDLLRVGGSSDRIFSLQGSKATLLSSWRALHDFGDRLEAFSRPAGIHLGLVGAIASRLRALRPRAVFVHHIGPLLYGGLAARLAGVPRLIYVEHDAWHYTHPRHRMLARCCFSLLRPQVVAVSRQVGAALTEMMPRLDVTIIPPGIPTDRFIPGNKTTARDRLGLPATCPIVGTAGRLVPVKSHQVLLRAMAELPDNIHCAIAGDGPELDNLRRLANELGLPHRIHFLGHRDDLWDVYPAFDVFCLPSEAEGLPRTILEAQACDIPVVATDVGGVAEALDPEASLLVPPNEPIMLANALKSLLSRLDKLSSPREFIQAKMSLAITSAQYHALYGR